MILERNLPKDLIKIVFVFVFVATFTFLALKLPNDSSAARGEFKAGNIISDYVMSKSDSMTVEEIDAFLHEKGNCNNSETYMASWYPSVHYHVEGDFFVCLADEKFADGTVYGDLIPEGTEGKTAAEIIFEVAQEYRINPEVLIVLLEKEQGLISDSWPNSLQYRSATGYGCPDTAACDSKYYGFKNQLSNAAALFRTVLNGGWTNYPLGENFIYYNPNRNCGGSVVNVENLATSALYRYTPYQPNPASLTVGYGTAYCGAYGNRNFFYLFSDWFGDPRETVDVRTPIQRYYESIGGESSYMGRAINKEVCERKGGGCYQNFSVGDIYWSENTGAWDVSGRIGDRWALLGREDGLLGYPTSTEGKGLINGGAYQKFEHGRIYWTKDIGAWEISGRIYEAWYEQGTEWGELGYPTSSEQTDENGIVYQQFEHGRIYLENENTWITPEWSEKRYVTIGTFESILKKPTSNGRCGLAKDGCFQSFEIGRIYWSENTGAWDISGRIYSTWYSLGTEWSELGYPMTSEQTDKNGFIYQQFEHGRIYYRLGKTWVVPKWAEEKYEDIGALNSTLKTPTNNGKCGLVNDGCYQNYEVGRLYWSNGTGTQDISGKIYEKWYSLGTEWGELGYPTSSEQTDENGIVYQQFEHGRIYYRLGKTWVEFNV